MVNFDMSGITDKLHSMYEGSRYKLQQAFSKSKPKASSPAKPKRGLKQTLEGILENISSKKDTADIPKGTPEYVLSRLIVGIKAHDPSKRVSVGTEVVLKLPKNSVFYNHMGYSTYRGRLGKRFDLPQGIDKTVIDESFDKCADPNVPGSQPVEIKKHKKHYGCIGSEGRIYFFFEYKK